MTGKTAAWILKARRAKARKLAVADDPVKARAQKRALRRAGGSVMRKKKKHGRQT